MNVRAQISMVFHLEKCIGCHNCSLTCKTVQTDRRGAEYMWWNNVETRSGVDSPLVHRIRREVKGGWNDDHEPWTYRYESLFDSLGNDGRESNRQGSLVPSRMPMTRLPRPIVSEEQNRQLSRLKRLVFFYLPRMCNHCLNPGCAAACPSGAIVKREEDGIVVVREEMCRAWRTCLSGCPYGKIYFNWATGKPEKCNLCAFGEEAGAVPACVDSCVHGTRYLGVVFYDADRIKEVASLPERQILSAQRDMILDPFSRDVITQALENGIPKGVIESAQRSPIYQFVKVWGMALPLHPENRTLPMLFYVPPLLPMIPSREDRGPERLQAFFEPFVYAKMPTRYLASLFASGEDDMILSIHKKLLAVRLYNAGRTAGRIEKTVMKTAFDEAGITAPEAKAIHRLLTLTSLKDRVVIPPEFKRRAFINPFKDANGGRRATEADSVATPGTA